MLFIRVLGCFELFCTKICDGYSACFLFGGVIYGDDENGKLEREGRDVGGVRGCGTL